MYGLRDIQNFYPRPPRGGRRGPVLVPLLQLPFLSTPSARRATCQGCPADRDAEISIHALREEGDEVVVVVVPVYGISIHALREEGDMTS